MVFPYGRGSTTGSAWLLETVRRGNGPAAIINVETEPILVTGLIMARLLYNIQIPLVDRPEEDVRAFLEEDTVIQVNGDTGYVTVGK
jgi:predicted aconitase with swiveling domain